MVLPDRLAAMLHVALREVLRLLRHQLPEVVQVAELVAEAALRFLHPSLEMLGMASRLVLASRMGTTAECSAFSLEFSVSVVQFGSQLRGPGSESESLWVKTEPVLHDV